MLVESFSGVRGIYGKDINESIAVKYAYSYLSFLRSRTKKAIPTIVIGMDTRPSGAKITDALLGVLDCSIIDVGIAPTPAIEFAVRHFNADGGIIITASHNEPYWNGFKFLGGDGAVLSAKDMEFVISNAKRLENFHKIHDRKIEECNKEAIEGYRSFILGIVGRGSLENIKGSKQKIVIDPNGGAGAIAKKIAEGIGVNVTAVNMQYGEFNRKVEPTEESMFYLKNIIDEHNAGFAAGFDCDADRIAILLDNGRFLSGHCILALAVQEVLSNTRNPERQTVVVNDATSNLVRDVVQGFGAKIKYVEAGETNVIEAMKASKAIVGGEGSSGGAIVFPSRCRDGILTMLMLLSISAKKQKKLSGIVKELPEYYTLRKNIPFDGTKHGNIKKSLKEHYSGKGLDAIEMGGMKGSLKIITGRNSFVWFRASKTEGDVFRIIADSDNEQEAEKLMEEAVQAFSKANAGQKN
ncbi:hypothetical protein HYX08_03855 [Candidatus Woesearchaeota archaeon]|nr:hypothetical protein [Candidatus Woesearchaeota archaeon]